MGTQCEAGQWFQSVAGGHQMEGHPLGEQWNPAGGISGTCVHLLCATQCLTDGRMSPNVFPLKVMNTAAVVDLCWHPLGLSPQQGFQLITGQGWDVVSAAGHR